MFSVGIMFTLLFLILMALSASSRDIHRNTSLLDTSEENDSVTIENPELVENKITPRQYGANEVPAEEEEEGDLETALQAFIEAAVVVEKLNEDLEEEGRNEMGTKHFGILAQIRPEQYLQPIGNKFSELSQALSHPNFGFQLPNPAQIWNRIKESGANFLNGANNAIFGQPEGQDYPYPYRNSEARTLREDFNNYQDSVVEQAMRNVAYWRERLNNYKESPVANMKLNRSTLSNPYFFPYFLGSDKFKDVIMNATTN